MTWLLAILLFFSGANLLALVLPFNAVLIALTLYLMVSRPIRLFDTQIALLGCALISAVAGILTAREFVDISSNLRQVSVVLVALALAATAQASGEAILRRYFELFFWFSVVGLIFFIVAPSFHVMTLSVPPRTYFLGLSSTLLDSGYAPFSAFGAYRFQGLFDEPGTYGALAAAAAMWMAMQRRRIATAILLVALMLSQSFGGILALMVLVVAKLLGRLSLVWRGAVLAVVVLAGIAIVLSVDQTTGYVANKVLSGQMRTQQLWSVVDRLPTLIAPSGFAESRILDVSPVSLTAGFLRSLVQLGLIISAIAFAILGFALGRMRLSSATGVFLAAIAIAGFMRVGVFDTLLGWFILFLAVSWRRPVVNIRPEYV